jgi:sec-independent protein translocase protein TatB
VFDISFGEIFLLGTAALVVLGPKRLPAALREMGRWIAKIRGLATQLSSQSGIDGMLRSNGFEGRLGRLPALTPGSSPAASTSSWSEEPSTFVPDKSREYPVEGPDAQGALPEDLSPAAVPELVMAAAPPIDENRPELAAPSA